MEPALAGAALWVLFGGSHIALGLPAVRDRLDPRVFLGTFAAVAAGTFSALVIGYAQLRGSGADGLALSASAGWQPVLLAVSALGMWMAIFGAAVFTWSPYFEVGEGTRQPRGFQRVSRHPFFVGTALWAAAHALLATRLVGTVFFAGFLALATVGPWLQDRKLLARRGESYARMLAATSTIPFAAILGGRQRLVVGELPWAHALVSLGLTLGVRVAHDWILAGSGLPLVVVIAGGGSFFSLLGLRRMRPAA